MDNFKDVKLDPGLKKEYENYKQIPEDAVFACAYFAFLNPFDFVEVVFFRKTKELDELWVAVWSYEIYDGLSDYSTKEQYDNFGCSQVALLHSDEASACRSLLNQHFRSQVGFSGPSDFIQSGIITEPEYKGIIDGLRYELDQFARSARSNRSEIIDVAEELGLFPEPTGTGPHAWRASCPRTSHPLYISTDSNTFGCGWCRRKGGSDELRAFVKDRRELTF